MSDCLYIVIPAYNEEENIEEVLRQWYPVVEAHDGEGRSRLLLIDDGSKDSTREKAADFAGTHPLMEVVTKPNGGHGSSVYYGYRCALRDRADYVFQTDSDGQTLPEEFEPFWEERENYCAIIGNRKHRQDGYSRILVTRALRALLSLIFRVRVTDANTPYRLMRAAELEGNLRLLPKNYHLTNVLLTVCYHKRRQKITYLPITFRPRQGGVNSINVKKIIKIGLRSLQEFAVWNRKVFGGK